MTTFYSDSVWYIHRSPGCSVWFRFVGGLS
jgi:hypothetical protein